MANASPTNLLEGLSVVSNRWQEAEGRPSQTSVIATAYTGEMANPDLAELRTREDRPTSFDFTKFIAAGSESLRKALHTGARGDTQRVDITYNTFVEPFSISMKQMDKNTISWGTLYANQMKNAVNNILGRADEWFLAQMVSSISEVNTSELGTFDETTNIFTVPKDEKEFYNDYLKAMLGGNDYVGETSIIGDSKATVKARQQLNQGTGNAENLGWQFGDIRYIPTYRPIFAGANLGSLVFPSGMVGVIPWIPSQNMKEVDINAAWTPVGDLGSIEVPVTGADGSTEYMMRFAVSHRANRADTLSQNGSAQDVVLEVEVSVDLGFMMAPLSDKRGTGDSVIFGADLEPDVANA